jgi:predicted transcriptional regulator
MKLQDALKKIERHKKVDLPESTINNNVDSMRPYEESKQEKASNEEEKREQLGNKKEAERNQKGSNKETIREQKGSNKAKIREQLRSNKGTTREQSGNKKQNKIYTITPEKRYKNNPPPADSNSFNLQRLSEQQKKIMLFILEKIIDTKQLATVPILHVNLSSFCNTTHETIKVQIKRLVKKQLLFRGDGKRGKGGYMIFKISQEVYKNLLDLKTQQAFSDGLNKGTNPSYSSSIIITTTNLPEDWKNINFESLKDYGFNEKHILQISKLDAVTPEELQNSINHFVFDLQENGKEKEIKKSPLAFFMGIIRGQGIYVAPKNYESLQDRKLRLKVEQEKQSKERREKLEDELFGIEFEKWHSKMSDAEIEQLTPDAIKTTKVAKEAQILSFLKGNFRKNHWDLIKMEKHADCFAEIG